MHAFFNLFGLAGMLLLAPVHAATAPAPAALTTVEALSRAHAAVVGVRATVAPTASSAETLGRERIGSGVVIGPDGLILTIGYLILEADTIQITTNDGKTLPARTVAYDQATGFGLLRPLLPLRNAVAVPLGQYQQTAVAEILMAATGGQDREIITTQLVSKRPFSGYWEYHIDMGLFTHPPLSNHSGAPVFNQRGELLGIGSLRVAEALGPPSAAGQRRPVNMFVPVDLLKPILAEMLETGKSKLSRRPWLGLTSNDQGGRVQVVRVSKNSPAQDAGVRAGDTVMAIDGTPVTTLEAFYKQVWQHTQPEVDIKLTLLQGGDIRVLTLKAVDREQTLVKPAGI